MLTSHYAISASRKAIDIARSFVSLKLYTLCLAQLVSETVTVLSKHYSKTMLKLVINSYLILHRQTRMTPYMSSHTHRSILFLIPSKCPLQCSKERLLHAMLGGISWHERRGFSACSIRNIPSAADSLREHDALYPRQLKK